MSRRWRAPRVLGRVAPSRLRWRENTLHVLDYERASEVVADGFAYWHWQLLLPPQDAAPRAVLRGANGYLHDLQPHRALAHQARHRPAGGGGEGRELLQRAMEHNLVQFGENVREQVSFICNCCGCCCEAMLAAKRFAVLNPIATTNFLPEIDEHNAAAAASAWSLSGGGDGAGLGRRIRISRSAKRRGSTKSCAWAAAYACGNAAKPTLPRLNRARSG